ncbi:WXG100 family type VII secretion target [Skermania sp. ID1734]|uniref:WXG100 family type VII secretion target n=1 Tax=Skermania sp. ID1734 TaxID=2597516 RepID=UPI0011802432|nr:WXG100 family type VII secretion target [Skermania sp. ID1734]TSE02105.1 WXG100 family type VII secretion target [Skermania sp. ID1734]
MSSPVIAANFGSVEEGAQSIKSLAQTIMDDLESFHSEVKGFVDNAWQGEANEAFATLQAQWHQRTTELNSMLNAAALAVSDGNAAMQAANNAAAASFGG